MRLSPRNCIDQNFLGVILQVDVSSHIGGVCHANMMYGASAEIVTSQANPGSITKPTLYWSTKME